jgi:hypothetical protein
MKKGREVFFTALFSPKKRPWGFLGCPRSLVFLFLYAYGDPTARHTLALCHQRHQFNLSLFNKFIFIGFKYFLMDWFQLLFFF